MFSFSFDLCGFNLFKYLIEATLALLRHPDYCISCYASVSPLVLSRLICVLCIFTILVNMGAETNHYVFNFQVDVKCEEEEGDNLFNQLSIEERGKFDEETLVNVDSIKRQSSKIRIASGFTNEIYRGTLVKTPC